MKPVRFDPKKLGANGGGPRPAAPQMIYWPYVQKDDRSETHGTGSAAPGSTVSSGPTTEPTYTTTLLRAAVNTAIGRDIVWDSGPVVPPGQIVGVRIVNRSGNTNITSARCLLEWEEIG